MKNNKYFGFVLFILFTVYSFAQDSQKNNMPLFLQKDSDIPHFIEEDISGNTNDLTDIDSDALKKTTDVIDDTLYWTWISAAKPNGWDTTQISALKWWENDTLRLGAQDRTVADPDVITWSWTSTLNPISLFYQNLKMLPEESRVRIFGPDYNKLFDNNGNKDDKEMWYMRQKDYKQNDNGLPVTLLPGSFKANYHSGINEVLIRWKTASELNSSHFELYKSIIGEDGRAKTSEDLVGKVQSLGNSSVGQDYEMRDENIPSLEEGELLEYHLTEKSLDGTTQDVARLKMDIENGVVPEQYEVSHPFPNPTNGASTIRYTLNEAAKVSIKLYNSAGQKVMEEVIRLSSGTYYGRLRFGGNMASGLYMAIMELYFKSAVQKERFKVSYIK